MRSETLSHQQQNTVCNLSTWKIEAGRGQPQLHGELEASMVCMGPTLKINNLKEVRQNISGVS